MKTTSLAAVSISDFCEAYNLDLDDTLEILQEEGVEFTNGDVAGYGDVCSILITIEDVCSILNDAGAGLPKPAKPKKEGVPNQSNGRAPHDSIVLKKDHKNLYVCFGN